MDIENTLQQHTKEAIKNLYNQELETDKIQVQITRKDFEGDYTIVVFPLLRYSKKSPEETANAIGEYLQENSNQVEKFNVVKGFLNLVIAHNYWINFFNQVMQSTDFAFKPVTSESETVMIEYSSPNTNKPLHLGHIRNNLLGYSIAEILKANGKKVIKVNLVNDRGIHICKSMLAWKKWGEGETPESSGIKGDHLVGKYYVKFEQEYRKQIDKLIEEEGISEKEAKKQAPLINEAQVLLRKWEKDDEEVRYLWIMMNKWVYQGFDETYKKMGIDFDKIYYESNTYELGKLIVLGALEKGILHKKRDGSVWANLESEGLDEKLLLRSDGTSVYMTQDIGTAQERYNEYQFDKLLYVVGNEQDYHFKVLSIILGKFGYSWANNLEHISYGMVELPEGKMKSREGKVVDADDLIEEMYQTAKKTSEELGKLDNYSDNEAREVYHTVAMGALKYFILKVDPRKSMTFNPKESIDFNGNTGPFIQYTHARICSVLHKAEEKNIEIPSVIQKDFTPNDKEKELIKMIHKYPEIVEEAGKNYSPATIANYVYNLVKEYNQFYHDFSILHENDQSIKQFRLALSSQIAGIIKSATGLLGFNVPEQM